MSFARCQGAKDGQAIDNARAVNEVADALAHLSRSGQALCDECVLSNDLPLSVREAYRVRQHTRISIDLPTASVGFDVLAFV